MSPQQVLVQITINAAGATAGANQAGSAFKKIAQDAAAAAKESALSFTSIFGANFFADLASNAVRAFMSGIRHLVTGAIAAARDVESAFSGLRGIGRNLGLAPGDVVASVKGMELVKSGLLSVGDAATAVKNLLASGFSLDQSIELVNRFADVAAFGRQASLSFGYAIASASEGVKNQNSILVDNIGLTKNLSVIMREAGFEIQDLSDKTKGAAARQALYNGLIKEASIQQGDAARILDTYQGKMLQVDAAQTRFLQSLGKTITESTLVRAGLSALVVVLDTLGQNIGSVTALTVAVTLLSAAIIAMNTSAVPGLVSTLTGLVGSVRLLGQVMVGTASLVQGATATMIAATAGWAALAIAIGAVIFAIYKYTSAQKEVQEYTKAQIDQTIAAREALTKQVEGLQYLQGAAGETTAGQKRLTDQYRALNVESRARISAMDAEASGARKLQAEIQRLLSLRNTELEVMGRTTTAQLIASVQEIRAGEAQVERLERRIGALIDAEARVRSGGFSPQQLRENDLTRDFASLPSSEIANQLRESNLAAQRDATNLTQKLAEQRTEAGHLLQKFDALSVAQRRSADQMIDVAAAAGNVNGNVQAGKDFVAGFRSEMELLNPALANTKTALDHITEALNTFGNTAEAIGTGRRSRVKDFVSGMVESAVAFNLTPGQLSQGAQGVMSFPGMSQVRDDIEAEARAKKLRESLEISLGLRDAPKKRKEATELDRLEEQLKRLSGGVQSFVDLTSKEFDIRFRVEALERVKRDFEKIIDLRRDLGLELSAPLPAPADVSGQQALIELLTRAVRVRDDVRKVVNEQRDAEDRLATLQRTVSLPVVDEGTRAQIKYLEAVRKRSDAEKDLTADVIAQSRLRRDYLADDAGATKEAFQRVTLDVIEQLNEVDRKIKENEIMRAIESGGQITVEQQISGRIKIDEPKVPRELTQIVDSARTISSDVAAILAKLPGQTGGTQPNGATFNAQAFLPTLEGILRSIGASPSVITARGQTGTHNRLDLDHRNAIDVGLSPNSEQGRALAARLRAEGVPYRAITAADIARGVKGTGEHFHIGLSSRGTGQDFRVGTMIAPGQNAFDRTAALASGAAFAGSAAGLLPGMLARSGRVDDVDERVSVNVQSVDVLEAKRELARKRATEARTTAERLATDEIRQNEASLHNQLIDFDLDLRLARSRSNVQREQEARRTALEIRLLEEDITKFDAGDAETRRRVEDDVTKGRLQGRMNLRQQIVELNDQIAHSGEDAALREKVAYLSAVREIQQAHEDAAASIIRSQVKIADATVYHADIANAKVGEFLANQKSITDAIADAKIGVIQTTFDFIDNGLQRAFSRLGQIGRLIAQITSDLLRPALTQAFSRLLGIGGGGQQGGGAGGGGSLANLLFGGGGGGGFGSARVGFGGTPDFNPASMFGGGSGIGGGQNNFFAMNPAVSQRASQLFMSGQASSYGEALRMAQSSAGFLPSLSGTAAQQASLAAAVQSGIASAGTSGGIAGAGGLHEAGHALGVGTGAAGVSGLTLAAALAAPAVGAQLGGMFFQNSRAASLIGTGAGLALGGAAGVALLGGSGAAIFGAGGALASFGAIAALLTNPFTIAAAGALLVGAYFLNRNARRRQEEQQRTQILNDANGALDQLIAQVRGGRMDGATALAQAAAIRQDYLNQVGQLKDSKTRRIAQATVRELDYRINILKQAAEAADRAAEVERVLTPTFNSGGKYDTFFGAYDGGGSARTSIGGFPSIDRHPAMLADDETVVNAQQRATLGGDAAFRRAGIPGYATGRVPVRSASSAYGGGAGGAQVVQPNVQVLAVLVGSDEAADELITRASPFIFAQKVQLQMRKDGQSGIVAEFLDQLPR